MAADRTILNALTTTFTPPPECSVYGHWDTTNTGVFFQGQSCSDGVKDAATCWPPVTGATPQGNLNGFGMYSPGLHCPVGYTAACSATFQSGRSLTSGLTSNYLFQFPLTAGESAIGCCPSGLACAYGNYQTCETVRRQGVVTAAGTCASGGPSYDSIGPVTIGLAGTTSASFAVFFGPMIQLVYKSEDLAPPTITSTASSVTSASTSAFTSTPTSSSGGSTTTQILLATTTIIQSDTGLSPATKIGIGIGVPLAIILAAALGCLLFFHRRRRLQRGPINYPELSGEAKMQHLHSAKIR